MSATEREIQWEKEREGDREKTRKGETAEPAKTLPKAIYLHLSIVGFSVKCNFILGLLLGKGYETFN